MNVSCPQCSTTYRVDPAKVPSAGVNARCANCSGVFRVSVERPQAEGQSAAAASRTGVIAEAPAIARAPEPRPEVAAERASEPASSAAAAAPAAPEAPAAAPAPTVRSTSPFGSTDPRARAKRLARALVSDIVVYHPERRERSRRDGTLRQEFRDEIRKSWEEYVAQVGAPFARETPFFRDALNEILAGGERVF